MKDKSKKHDHKGTKILKLSIFASVMLAPLFAIAFKCAYATFNKNAYQSYSDKDIQALVKVTNNEVNVIEGATYNLFLNPNRDNYTGTVYFTDTNIDWNYLTNSELSFTPVSLRFNTLQSNPYVWLKDNLENETRYSIVVDRIDYLNGKYIIYKSGPLWTNGTAIEFYLQTTKTNSLDNAFYYAVDQMKDNNLFAWTKNTALYTPINAMTSGLGITTDAIAVLLAYWLYITLIYVVFDIVIELFTYLSHLIMGNPIG